MWTIAVGFVQIDQQSQNSIIQQPFMMRKPAQYESLMFNLSVTHDVILNILNDL